MINFSTSCSFLRLSSSATLRSQYPNSGKSGSPSSAYFNISTNTLRAETVAPLFLLILVVPFGIFDGGQIMPPAKIMAMRSLPSLCRQNLPLRSLSTPAGPNKISLFLPSRPILDAATPEEAVKAGVHYFALTPKDVRYQYGRPAPSWRVAPEARQAAFLSLTGIATAISISIPLTFQVNQPRLSRLKILKAGIGVLIRLPNPGSWDH